MSLEQPASILPTYPLNGTVFTLTIVAPFTGLEMVRRFGYNPENWKFNGEEIAAPQTKQFMLVEIGSQPNLEAVNKALAQHGVTPLGQWCAAFKEAYPQPDGIGPIGIAKSSWVDPLNSVNFPCVDTGGVSSFIWTVSGFEGDWRWLVEVQKK